MAGVGAARDCYRTKAATSPRRWPARPMRPKSPAHRPMLARQRAVQERPTAHAESPRPLRHEGPTDRSAACPPGDRNVAIAIARPAPARGQKQSRRAGVARARIWALYQSEFDGRSLRQEPLDSAQRLQIKRSCSRYSRRWCPRERGASSPDSGCSWTDGSGSCHECLTPASARRGSHNSVQVYATLASWAGGPEDKPGRRWTHVDSFDAMPTT
jgi:hypothetical protein